MRACDGQNLGVRAGDIGGVSAQTARHDHTAILRQSLANGRKTFGLGGIQKAAGVDDDGICALIIGRDGVALGAQPCQNTFGIHQRLGAAQRHHANRRLPCAPFVGNKGAGKVGAKVGRVLRHEVNFEKESPIWQGLTGLKGQGRWAKRPILSGQRRRSRRALIGWKATPTWASQ